MVETDTNSPTWKFTQYVPNNFLPVLCGAFLFHYSTTYIASRAKLRSLLLTCDNPTDASVTREMSRI